MSELTLHGTPVGTVFDLLGQNEDDITYSLGWALANCDLLARRLLSACGLDDSGEIASIGLQGAEHGHGRTDLTIETAMAHLVLEAKRGWTLPTVSQLTQYVQRFDAQPKRRRAFLVVAEASPEWAAAHDVPSDVEGVAVTYLSWAHVRQMVLDIAVAERSRATKALLRELAVYLKGVMTVRDVNSNLVYVVSLNTQPFGPGAPSYADLVTQYGRYFHPVGGSSGGWPHQPPNYLGFRYDGRTRQIRHVESYTVHDEPLIAIDPALAPYSGTPTPHYLYTLGPVIEPPVPLPPGPGVRQAARVWVALDLLLTAETLTQARDLTRQRQEGIRSA